jgi:hypothetical protein
MNPLLTAPDIATAPIEAAPDRASAPIGALALQALLLAATAAVVWIWLWTWHGVQAYAWPGVDNGLAERGLSYLLILAPAVPVNLLAAIWLGRGGRRAQLYLAAAGALALVQALLLLTPAAMPSDQAMSDGSAAVGMRFLVTLGPIVFAGAWIATTTRARAWLGATAPTRRLVNVETAVWFLALALAVGTGTEVRQWAGAAAEPGAPEGAFTEDGTWARLEQAVTETTGTVPGFTGFSTRTLDVIECGYRTPAGLPTYRYLLTYELRAPAEDAVAARWAEEDFTLTYDGATLEGTRRITAERVYAIDAATHTVTLGYTGGEQPALHLQSPCVERTSDTPECLPAQGDPTVDATHGITCPTRD